MGSDLLTSLTMHDTGGCRFSQCFSTEDIGGKSLLQQHLKVCAGTEMPL